MSSFKLDTVVIQLAGDSGDGIQLIGNQLSDVSVIKSGNDIYTFVDYPSEIRAPAGSLSGVSGFSVAISSKKIFSVDSYVDFLVAFNPAALKLNFNKLKPDGLLLIDLDSFNDKNFKRAGFTSNPIESGLLSKFKLLSVPMTSLTYDCVIDILNVVSKAKRCKNFFALGIVCWIYDRDLNGIISWLRKKFNDNENFHANFKALNAGYNYCSNLEISHNRFFIPSVNFYNNDDKLVKISGNKAFSAGAVVSTFLFDLPLFSANYPITPASEIFHDLLNYCSDKIKVFQFEDEIAAINSVIGASYGGSLALTCTSGPGLDLMQEGIGLAIMSELPVVILNVQRCGPSTGIPTKSEQTDLFSAIFGRHGESAVIVLAPNSPVDCFWAIIEGFCLAVFSSSPVIILSDANLANSSELWKVPFFDDICDKMSFDFKSFNNRKFSFFKGKKLDYDLRWKTPNTSDLFCIGGLERDVCTGNVSHDSVNHFSMIKYRSNKINDIAFYIDDVEVIGEKTGNLLVITWGSVFGVVKSIYNDINFSKEIRFSIVCLRCINPLPKNFLAVIKSFCKIVVVEENMGQLAFILKAKYCIDVFSINQVTGKPFDFYFLKEKILSIL